MNKKGVGGRPSKYSKKIADEICESLMEGESLRSVSARKGFPDKSTIFRWLAKYSEFCDQYEKAKWIGADYLFEELLEIADDSRNDYIEVEGKNGEVKTILNRQNIVRAKLRIDTRKWTLSKLIPKKYGNRLVAKTTGKNGDMSKLSDEELRDIISEKMIN